MIFLPLSLISYIVIHHAIVDLVSQIRLMFRTGKYLKASGLSGIGKRSDHAIMNPCHRPVLLGLSWIRAVATRPAANTQLCGIRSDTVLLSLLACTSQSTSLVFHVFSPCSCLSTQLIDTYCHLLQRIFALSVRWDPSRYVRAIIQRPGGMPERLCTNVSREQCFIAHFYSKYYSSGLPP